MGPEVFSVIFTIGLLLLIVGSIVGPSLYWRRLDQQRTRRMTEWAAQHGWACETAPLPILLYSIGGQSDGVQWEVTSQKQNRGDRKRNPHVKTIWRCNQPAPAGEAVLIARRTAQMPRQHMDSTLVQWTWKLFLGPYFGIENTEGLDVRSAGSTLFQEKFVVIGKSDEGARRLASPAVENQLLNWPEAAPEEMPIVVVDKDGVSVRVDSDRMNDEPERVERMIALGVALTNGLRR